MGEHNDDRYRAFNNKGGVGKTTLAYHLAHMVARLGWRVLAADLDPQANLTSQFFDEEQLERFWDQDGADTIVTAINPLLRGIGDVRVPVPHEATDRLWVLPGDLDLSRFEDRLSESWPRSYEGNEGALRVTTAFHRNPPVVRRRCRRTRRVHRRGPQPRRD